MKTGILFSIVLSSIFLSTTHAQVSADQDTIVIPGDIPHGTIHHAGALESTINGDTTVAGERINPNRVYALREGHFYYQNAAINVTDPNGILTIVGIPDSAGTTKPVILLQPVGGTAVGANIVYGSIAVVNVHWQSQQLNGSFQNELFYCGTKNELPQSLTIDNCLFEFSNIDLFDCTNESGAIGGWPYGAKFFITNSYFRNMFNASQWWGSRVFQCKHPIDTLWVENNTVVGAGLTFLQQNELTDFAYINHNTIVNNKKYWLLSLYYRCYFVTNNIFINQNWVGEDTNVISNGQDPRKEFQSTIDIDSVNAAEGVVVQPKYYSGDSVHYSPLLALNKLKVDVSDNVNYYDPLLINGYYNTAPGTIDSTAYPLSYLRWYYPGIYRVENIPCEWMNTRTAALFAAYSPDKGGGFIERHTTTANPNTFTPGIANASVVTMMTGWNQNQWGDPRYPVAPDIVHSKYIFGDYDPTTIPGRDSSGNKTENGSGITKFTDLMENFSQSSIVSAIDGYPVGSLIWNDAQNAAYAAAHAGEWARVYSDYIITGIPYSVKPRPDAASVFSLGQNYPNPFNPATQIAFTVPPNNNERITLKVFNVLGEEIATLFSGIKSAGNYSVPFDGSKYSSGVYFYRLQSGSVSFTRKMLLMK